MSKLLLDVRTPDLHTLSLPSLADSTASLSLADRASLRLGLWLLLRGARRAERHADHETRARRVRHESDRVAREAATLRLHQLAPRP